MNAAILVDDRRTGWAIHGHAGNLRLWPRENLIMLMKSVCNRAEGQGRNQQGKESGVKPPTFANADLQP